MLQILSRPYTKDGFELSRLFYFDLPEDLKPKIGDWVQQADSPQEEEFRVLEINDNEVKCFDKQTEGFRWFYLDSLRVSEWEFKRQKKALAFKRKQEKWALKDERAKKRAEKLLLKLEKEEKKKQKKFKFVPASKKSELTIKFI